MTDADDAGTAGRRTRLAKAIAAHRSRGGDPVRFAAADPGGPNGGDGPTGSGPDDGREYPVEYADRSLRLELDAGARDRLDDLLGEFPVFKIEQPATRKAPEGVVYVSAIADPKHTADFVDRVFLDAFEHPDDYELVVEG